MDGRLSWNVLQSIEKPATPKIINRFKKQILRLGLWWYNTNHRAQWRSENVSWLSLSMRRRCRRSSVFHSTGMCRSSFPFTLIINCSNIKRPPEHFARKLSVRRSLYGECRQQNKKRKKLNDLRERSPRWLSTNRNFFRYFFVDTRNSFWKLSWLNVECFFPRRKKRKKWKVPLKGTR